MADETKKCQHCYSDIDARASTCPNCGKRLYSNALLYGLIAVGIVLFGLLTCAGLMLLLTYVAYDL